MNHSVPKVSVKCPSQVRPANQTAHQRHFDSDRKIITEALKGRFTAAAFSFSSFIFCHFPFKL